jgi:glycosyltransferase involved in cell wall biosynthesis
MGVDFKFRGLAKDQETKTFSFIFNVSLRRKMSAQNAEKAPPEASHSDTRRPDRVAILLCTFNGAAFLAEQLDSIEKQDHQHWTVVASDDGSSDETPAILARFANRHTHRVEIRRGPSQGSFVANFRTLACDPQIDAEFFAFCDQDDVWFPDKLTRALAVLARQNPAVPAVYCGRTLIIDEAGEPRGYSPLFARRPSFRNAVIQSIGGGNTMVFNRAARDLLAKAPNANPVSHDWWTYQVVTAVGGTCHYDPVPAVAYRQHAANTMGANVGWMARILRAKMVVQGRFSEWTLQNLEALQFIEPLMTEKSRATLRDIEGMRSPSLISRLRHLWQSGVYRQTVYGSIGLVGAVIFRRL